MFPAGVATGDITEMEAGSVMLKCGRSGRPHFALFQLSDDSRYIQWTSRRNDPGRTRIKIENIRELCLGQLTAVFARAGMGHYSPLSFSIVSQDRSVDIISTSRREYNTWVNGIQTLLPSGARVRSAVSGQSPQQQQQQFGKKDDREGENSHTDNDGEDDNRNKSNSTGCNANNDSNENEDEKSDALQVLPLATPQSPPPPSGGDNNDNDNNDDDDDDDDDEKEEMMRGDFSSDDEDEKAMEDGEGCSGGSRGESDQRWRQSSTEYSPRRRSKSMGAGERKEYIGTNRNSKYMGITARAPFLTTASDYFDAKRREENKNVYIIQLKKVDIRSPKTLALSSPLMQTLTTRSEGAFVTSSTMSSSTKRQQPPSPSLTMHAPPRSLSSTLLFSGQQQQRWRPQELELVGELIGKDICGVAIGAKHYAAFSIHGDLYMWGDNEFGQQGVRSHPPRMQPYQAVPNEDEDGAVSSVAAIKPDPIRFDTFVPHIVPLGGAVIHSVACGKNHTLCATVNGALFAWGRNTRGQLGLGDTVQRTEPTLVAALRGTPVIIIACGPHTSAAYTDSGRLYMWGQNDSYQLGINHTRQVRSPQLVYSSFVTILRSEKSKRRQDNAGDILADVCIDPTEMDTKADTVPFAPYRKNVMLAKRVKQQQMCCDGSAAAAAASILTPSSSVSSLRVSPHPLLSSSSSSVSTIRVQQNLLPNEQVEEIALGQYHSAVLTSKYKYIYYITQHHNLLMFFIFLKHLEQFGCGGSSGIASIQYRP